MVCQSNRRLLFPAACRCTGLSKIPSFMKFCSPGFSTCLSLSPASAAQLDQPEDYVWGLYRSKRPIKSNCRSIPAFSLSLSSVLWISQHLCVGKSKENPLQKVLGNNAFIRLKAGGFDLSQYSNVYRIPKWRKWWEHSILYIPFIQESFIPDHVLIEILHQTLVKNIQPDRSIYFFQDEGITRFPFYGLGWNRKIKKAGSQSSEWSLANPVWN